MAAVSLPVVPQPAIHQSRQAVARLASTSKTSPTSASPSTIWATWPGCTTMPSPRTLKPPGLALGLAHGAMLGGSLKPEQFTNYEVGAKWDVNPDLSITAAVFTPAGSTPPSVLASRGSSERNSHQRDR